MQDLCPKEHFRPTGILHGQIYGMGSFPEAYLIKNPAGVNDFYFICLSYTCYYLQCM